MQAGLILAGMKTGLHTHFASGLHALNIFLTVLLFGTFWRLAAGRLANSSSPFVRAIAGQMFVQF